MIFQKEGLGMFYRGYPLTLLYVCIQHGGSFFIGTNIKEYCQQHHESKAKKWYVDFISGSLGSVMGQLLGYPLDRLRKRYIALPMLSQTGEQKQALNLLQLAGQIYREEGLIKGYYKGLSLTLIKYPIAGGIVWTVRHHINRMLDKHFDF